MHTRRKLTWSVRALALGSLLGLLSCAESPREQGDLEQTPDGSAALGEVQFYLTLGKDPIVGGVRYQITGNGIAALMGVMHEEATAGLVSLTVNLRAGRDYTLIISAYREGGEQVCMLTTKFDVIAGTVSNENLKLQCDDVSGAPVALDAGAVDAGAGRDAARDAQIASDAGVRRDAAEIGERDADVPGRPVAAGDAARADAAPQRDAAPAYDATPEYDAGAEYDAASEYDADSAEDAAQPSEDAAVDTGMSDPLPDAGEAQSEDAGADAPDAGAEAVSCAVCSQTACGRTREAAELLVALARAGALVGPAARAFECERERCRDACSASP